MGLDLSQVWENGIMEQGGDKRVGSVCRLGDRGVC